MTGSDDAVKYSGSQFANIYKVAYLRIISKKKLREFWDRYPDAKKPLMEWYDIIEQAAWRNFSDVKNTFRHADSYCDCTIFDIKGNDYRLIAIILYQAHSVYARHALTYKENDLAQTDLLPIFKSRGYISEVLSGKRAISKRIAKALGARFSVSAELFI